LAQCQFKVTAWGIMFICGMVCWHLKTQFESGPVTADLTTTKLLINDVKPVHLLYKNIDLAIYEN